MHDQADEPEEVLVGGDVTLVVRRGATVRRTPGPWTPAVHALLRHLEAKGFPGAPRVLGYDDAGREVLSYVEGEPALLPLRAELQSDDVLAGLGRLLRGVREAVVDFVAPPGAVWQFHVGAPGAGRLCHNDIFPPNVILRDGLPFALIDWDLASPAPDLFDIASAAKFWVPLMTDDRAASEGWIQPDQPGRLRLLCDAYGLDRTERETLLSVCLRKQHIGYDTHLAWSQAGVPGFVEMVRNGSLDSIRGDMAWLLENWDQLAAALH